MGSHLPLGNWVHGVMLTDHVANHGADYWSGQWGDHMGSFPLSAGVTSTSSMVYALPIPSRSHLPARLNSSHSLPPHFTSCKACFSHTFACPWPPYHPSSTCRARTSSPPPSPLICRACFANICRAMPLDPSSSQLSAGLILQHPPPPPLWAGAAAGGAMWRAGQCSSACASKPTQLGGCDSWAPCLTSGLPG